MFPGNIPQRTQDESRNILETQTPPSVKTFFLHLITLFFLKITLQTLKNLVSNIDNNKENIEEFSGSISSLQTENDTIPVENTQTRQLLFSVESLTFYHKSRVFYLTGFSERRSGSDTVVKVPASLKVPPTVINLDPIRLGQSDKIRVRVATEVEEGYVRGRVAFKYTALEIIEYENSARPPTRQ